MSWMGGPLNISKDVIVDGHRMAFLGYYVPEINDEDWKYGDETLYDVYLIKGFDQEYLNRKNVIIKCFIFFLIRLCYNFNISLWRENNGYY
mgnify:CR=1 FL=1